MFGACGFPSNQTSTEGKILGLITALAAKNTDTHQNEIAFIFSSETVETLVGIDPQTLQTRPWLAERWETTDVQNWTLTLRKGVRFYNGTEMTAERVKASLENSVAANLGIKKALRAQSIEMTDQYTLKIVTETAYPAPSSNLVYYSLVIADTSAKDPKLLIGTGAFKFKSFDINGGAVLMRNDNYYDGGAKLNRVVMAIGSDTNGRRSALQAGDVDVIRRPSLDSLSALQAGFTLQVDSRPGTRVYHILYNYSGFDVVFWGSKEFHKGIDVLMDRESIVKDVMGGQAQVAYNVLPGDYPISPKMAAHPPSTEEALEHFEAAGLQASGGKMTRDDRPLILKLVTHDARLKLLEITQVIQDQVHKIGIDMQIVKANNINGYLPRNDWDLATYSLLTITHDDGSFFLNSSFGEGATRDHGKFTDPKLLTKLEKYNTEAGTTARTILAKETAQYIDAKYYDPYIIIPYETSASKKTMTGRATLGSEFELQMTTKNLDIS